VVSSLACVESASADVWVRGYVRSNGTYVRPHYRSNPDGNFWNNWSTYPNVNPYTGRTGTLRTPSYRSYRSYSSPSYRSYRSYSSPSYRSTTPYYRKW
jgi:hypothetical protein